MTQFEERQAEEERLWLAVEGTFVPRDFWCHSHGRWVSEGCDESCRTVSV